MNLTGAEARRRGMGRDESCVSRHEFDEELDKVEKMLPGDDAGDVDGVQVGDRAKSSGPK